MTSTVMYWKTYDRLSANSESLFRSYQYSRCRRYQRYRADCRENAHNILECDEDLAIKKNGRIHVGARGQQADAEASRVNYDSSREEAETKKVQEERRRATMEQDLAVQTENQREIEVAEQNRQRAVAIEEEKVTCPRSGSGVRA